MPLQTAQIFFGVAVSLAYAIAVAAIGTLALRPVLTWRSAEGSSTKLSRPVIGWLGFVTGQGILGALWLALGLAGAFQSSFVWMVCVAGWLAALAIIIAGRGSAGELRLVAKSRRFVCARKWTLYHWVVASVILILLLRGFIALLPTNTDDALEFYLVTPHIVALQKKLELQPFLFPYYGLQPLQIEMHWAALFAIANETAVNVWDYLCAVSYLSGIGLLAYTATSNYRVSIVAVAIMLSTPAFLDLMGAGKTDNAAAQYGVAAFFWLLLFRLFGVRAMMMAGLCAGWAVASRFTNVILAPALILVGATIIYDEIGTKGGGVRSMFLVRRYLTAGWIAVTAAAVAVAPMLLKNWLLIGCPLAPVVGCQGAFSFGTTWIKSASSIYAGSSRNGASLVELFTYPYVWTLGLRPGMVGRLSPLFIGLFPLILLYFRSPLVRAGALLGAAGFIGIVSWWTFLNNLFPLIRWLLVPLGLCAVLLSTAVIAAEKDLRIFRPARVLVVTTLLTLLFFFLFHSRAVVYAVRYVAAIDDGRARYNGIPGHELRDWLNKHIKHGERIAGWYGYSHLLRPDILLNAESADEFRWLWDRCRCRAPARWNSDFWRFYVERGFTYVIVARRSVDEALAALPHGTTVDLAFVGRNEAVLRIGNRRDEGLSLSSSAESLLPANP
ncbi:MAG TPA: hypothetical protein VNO43_08470 [Candidatus Eisenbacteria bacterium]|nr:hypothetical protein [Candidatus Eisenbacteria bacterium]